MTYAVSCIALPYTDDSSHLFTAFVDWPYPVFLDSAYPHITTGRYDIISAHPSWLLRTHGLWTSQSFFDMHHPGKAIIYTQENFPDDPFSLAKKQLSKADLITYSHVPFSGGLLGYFNYDLANRLENLPPLPQQDITGPDIQLGLYAWAIVTDHEKKERYLVMQPELPKVFQTQVEALVQEPLKQPTDKEYKVTSQWQADMDFNQYKVAFDQAKEAIFNGDCYQINLARRFHATVEGSPWAMYQHLRQANPAPYSAFIKTDHGAILSLSPEAFLQVTQGRINTHPIKGTRPRGTTKQQDQKLAQALKDSTKDRAENIMIVDLMRNDLARCCEAGSIGVPVLCELQSFAAVHHLVSKVEGRLRTDCHSLDSMRACFPGGSITGAPKVSAMTYISTLEPHHRSTYCGSVAYVNANGDMQSNIAIRTPIWSENTLYCHAGGGIVADSTAEAEFQEGEDKVRKIIQSLCP